MTKVPRSNSRPTLMTMAPYDSVLSARTSFSPLSLRQLRQRKGVYQANHDDVQAHSHVSQIAQSKQSRSKKKKKSEIEKEKKNRKQKKLKEKKAIPVRKIMDEPPENASPIGSV